MKHTSQEITLLHDALQKLLDWYAQNARVLPWRQSPTPYHVWISEIMLQQTRVEAVKAYYTRFIARYPDIASLADADPDELSKYWEGLGYYSRMRNLHRCARVLCDQYGGILPQSYEELLKLPGIGSYTAGAIASIAYGKPVPAVDGNLLRVLSRLLADPSPIDDPKTKQNCFALLSEVMPDDAGSCNQALMDLGATICLPNGAPLCESCPVRDCCKAFQSGIQQTLPVRKPKKQRRIEQITFLLIQTPDGFLLHKRPDTGLLASLWEYPNLPGKLTPEQVTAYCSDRRINMESVKPLPDKKHIFTHIEWQITGYYITARRFAPGENEVFASEAQIRAEYAIPTAFDQYDRTAL